MALYKISTNEDIDIKESDWVELVPGLLEYNGFSGLSFEVSSLYDYEVGILAKTNNDEYSEVILSPIYITSNFRKV